MKSCGQYASKISVSPDNIELCLSQNHPSYSAQKSSIIFLSDLLQYFDEVKTLGQATSSSNTKNEARNIRSSPQTDIDETEWQPEEVVGSNETKECKIGRAHV